jgi:hypothetical protein
MSEQLKINRRMVGICAIHFIYQGCVTLLDLLGQGQAKAMMASFFERVIDIFKLEFS